MATGYAISIGYMSGGEWTEEAAFEKLCEEARHISKNAPVQLLQKVLASSPTPWWVDDMIVEVCETYTLPPFSGNPLFITEDHVNILCSGPDPYRSLKERVARTFVRTLMERMHILNIEINVNVV